MTTNIDLLETPRVELGWAFLSPLIEALAHKSSKVIILYDFETNELLITDQIVLDTLNKLNIPFKESHRKNSLRFVLKK